MDLEETRAFLAVLDHGSFKAAAETIRQPRATLRRRVEALEARAGVPLLERSRSGVEPTVAGTLLARQARVMLRESNALLNALRELGDEPTGELEVGAPVGLPPQAMAVVFGLFQDEFPRLRLHLHVSDEPLAELLDRVDVALHFGDQPLSGRWATHTLLRTHEGLRASRSYLQRHGVPQSIADLREHELLGWRGAHDDPGRWPTYDGGSFGVEPVLTTTDQSVLRQFAQLGLGIALLPDSDLPALEHDDELIPVLDGIVGRSRELQVVVPEVLAETAKIRRFVAHLDRCVSALQDRETEPAPRRFGGAAYV